MDPDRIQPAKKLPSAFFSSMLWLMLIILLFSCNKNDKWIEVDPAFSRYIDAYTTGIVSKTAAVRIQLASSSNTVHAVGEEVKEQLFELSPAVKGKAVWIDATTVEFKPEANLQPGQLYQVNFKLGKVTSVDDRKFNDFKFSLQTAKPSFVVKDEGLRSAAAKNRMFLQGELETADVEDGKLVEKLLTATVGNKNLAIKWQHNDAAKSHLYTIEGIERTNNSSELKLVWNGKPLGVELTAKKLWPCL